MSRRRLRSAVARLAPALVLLLLAAPCAMAYTRSTTTPTDGGGIAWDLANAGTVLPNVHQGQVVYRLHAAGAADIADGSDLKAVEGAFRTWSGVSGSSLAFARGIDTDNTTTLNDGEFTLFWTEASTIVDQGTASPSDDVSVAGALAMTLVYRYTSGEEKGEIIDANIVFNGAEFAWTTDPLAEPARYDVEAVAAHEIGHALGLDHSPVAAATLFPRMRAGTDAPRSLSADDVAGIIAAYPGGNTAANRGVVKGVLSDGSPVFGGLVWVLDANGVVAGHAMSDVDGSFRIAGLKPGPVVVHAQPVNDAAGFSLFSAANLGSYYSALDRSFSGGTGVSATVIAGAEVAADPFAVDGEPAADLKLIGRNGAWSNVSTWVRRGEAGITIGVAGPGVPTAGTPLSVTGPGITPTATSFTSVAGYPAVRIQVEVAPDAPLGPRDLVVHAAGGARVTAIGAVEVRFPLSAGPPPEVVSLSAALVGASVDLAWSVTPRAEWYRLYRGDLLSLAGGASAPEAVECHISTTDASRLEDAVDGGAYYYLVTGGSREGEGPPGTDATGTPRPTLAPACP